MPVLQLSIVEKCDKKFLNQFLASFLCNLNVLVACSCFTWLEPLTVWLTSDESEIKMTSRDISWLSASIELGEFLAGIPSGYLADKLGRKPVILSIGPLGLTGWLLAIFTRNLAVMYVIRVIQGIILGISMTVTPTYIAEISSANIRGAFGGHTVVFIYLGFLYSYCAGYYLKFEHYIYAQTVLPIIFFLTYVFVPESPYYLYMKSKEEKATKALTWLRGGNDVTEEATEISESVKEDMKRKGNWKDLIATKSDRRAMLIVQIVNIATYMTGVQSVAMYAGQTFMTTPLLWLNAGQLTIAMGVVLCVSAFLASFVADTVGRRKLLIVSSAGITISNLIITIYYFLAEKTDVQISQESWILFIGVFGLCVLTNIGVGELVHTMQGEFFPSHTRSLAGGVTSAVASIAIFISVKTYQPLIEMFGVYMNFAVYTVISFISYILIIIYMTESAGKTLSQVNQHIAEVVQKKENP